LIFREQLTDTVVVEVDDKVVEVVKTVVVDTKSSLGVIVALGDDVDASVLVTDDVLFISWTVEDVAPHEVE
jgi:hypothetical protein